MLRIIPVVCALTLLTVAFTFTGCAEMQTVAYCTTHPRNCN